MWLLGPNGESISALLAFSYDVMPIQLKRCFLYLSLFPGGYEISAVKLIQLWVAENIIIPVRNEYGEEIWIEDVAENCLMELVERRFVQVGERDANLKIKTCYLNDMIREMCVSKAEEESFAHIIDTSQVGFHHFRAPRLAMHVYDDMERIKVPDLRSLFFLNVIFSDEFIYRSLNRSDEIDSTKHKPWLSTLLLLRRVISKFKRLWRYLIKNFKSLRVLEFEGAEIYVGGELQGDIGDLNSMKNLRELRISRHFILEDVEEVLDLNNEHLRSLFISISSPDPDPIDPKHLIVLLSNCVNICELTLTVAMRELPAYHQFSTKITYMYLSKSNLHTDPMPMLEKLPNLKVLELREAFIEKEIFCSSDGFAQLDSLKLIENSNLEEWRVDENAMPKLRRLEIVDCRSLEMLPVGLRLIKTLKELKMEKMPKAFKARLVEGGEDFCNFQHISPIIFQNCN
ncbi:hypothetical protein REPUB_Repub10bG0054600 [Reevesia pubescens]